MFKLQTGIFSAGPVQNSGKTCTVMLPLQIPPKTPSCQTALITFTERIFNSIYCNILLSFSNVGAGHTTQNRSRRGRQRAQHCSTF